MILPRSLAATLFAGCSLGGCHIQPAPQANVVVQPDRRPRSPAVLVLPTTCVAADVELCSPAVYFRSPGDSSGESSSVPRPGPPIPDTFAAYIDPALRLKLEFAGFTLAEAAAMRITTADRVDVNGVSHVEETTPGAQTVAQLGGDDVRTVASSLALSGIVVPTLTLQPAEHHQLRAELSVALVDVATNQPLWTVTCSEMLYDPSASTNRLANCVGNGVLAVLAPENLIGEVL